LATKKRERCHELIALGWLATGAIFLFLSVLVLVPGIFG
jgi:hypothetical protein